MELFCPQCGFKIISKDINVSKNICYCKDCSGKYSIFDILYGKNQYDLNEILGNPPKGIWIKNGNEEFIIGVLLYSKKALPLLFLSVIGLIPFVGAIGTMIFHKTLNVIEWLPFLIVSGIILQKIYFQLFGKIEFVFCGQMYVFSGIGKLGKKKYIDWKSVKKIYEVPMLYDKDDTRKYLYIEIEGQKTIIIPLHYISDLQSEYLSFVLKHCVNSVRP
jgi:hypothetical protein